MSSGGTSRFDTLDGLRGLAFLAIAEGVHNLSFPRQRRVDVWRHPPPHVLQQPVRAVERVGAARERLLHLGDRAHAGLHVRDVALHARRRLGGFEHDLRVELGLRPGAPAHHPPAGAVPQHVHVGVGDRRAPDRHDGGEREQQHRATHARNVKNE